MEEAGDSDLRIQRAEGMRRDEVARGKQGWTDRQDRLQTLQTNPTDYSVTVRQKHCMSKENFRKK